MCEGNGVNTARCPIGVRAVGWCAFLAAAVAAWPQAIHPAELPPTRDEAAPTPAGGTHVAAVPPGEPLTHPAAAAPGQPTRPPSAPAGPALDEGAFRLIAERNIFNASRSGGQVRLPSRRPARVETFTLVGTLAYHKGAFAFFEGSSSEWTRALKPADVIAGHKLVEIYPNAVKLEADGREWELPVGGQMRREDDGPWQLAEASSGGPAAAPNALIAASGRFTRTERDGDAGRWRPDRGASETHTAGPPRPALAPATQEEILQRLRERREKE